MASDFVVFQNYPNPFNPQTVIEYYLPRSTRVNLTIYNVLGRKIKVLVNNFQTKGIKSITWDGKDQKGRMVATGIYFYRLETTDYAESKKMLLIK
ncbi:MAG: T9SS type A sorting domain-containing protein [Candidatus Zixiibacteriota bacterium]